MGQQVKAGTGGEGKGVPAEDMGGTGIVVNTTEESRRTCNNHPKTMAGEA